MVITLQALAEAHIPTILEACADWPELAPFGPPYWRPRSSAELCRKIADTAGPQPATAYSFVLAGSDWAAGRRSLDPCHRLAQPRRPGGHLHLAAERSGPGLWRGGQPGSHRLGGWLLGAASPGGVDCGE